MPRGQCSVAECSRTGWRSCERCNQPFCNTHARWYRAEFVRGSWATFMFVCYGCVPPGAGEAGGLPDPGSEAGPDADG